MPQKYILKVFVTIQNFKNITQQWLRTDKIDARALKALTKMKRRFLGAMHSH